MNYRVVFAKKAKALLDAWTFLDYELGRASSPVAAAVDEAIGKLSFSAPDIGESRDNGERILIVDPVSLIYEVFEDDGTALVFDAVIHYGRR